jgi:hypothetical protein
MMMGNDRDADIMWIVRPGKLKSNASTPGAPFRNGTRED